MKAKRGKRVGMSSIISESGDVVHDAKSIADVLNNQYKSVFCTDNAIDSSPITHRTSETMQLVEINYHGIVGLLEKIQVSKSCGPDGVSGALLKNCAKVAAKFLKIIFEQSLQTGDLPKDWGEALVHPVFKGGNHKKPENYRPISLTCICCKMMERILVASIVTHLEDAGLLTEYQHGFRRRLSCETQLIMLCQDLLASIDNRKCIEIWHLSILVKLLIRSRIIS